MAETVSEQRRATRIQRGSTSDSGTAERGDDRDRPAASAPAAPTPISEAGRAELDRVAERLDGAHPREVLAWGVERFGETLTMATAFGAEGCLLIHLLAELRAPVRVFNLDTGYQFAETLELRDRIAARYGIEVEMVRPDLDVPSYEANHGGPLYRSNPDRCCHDRKLVPLRRAVVGYDAWIASIRADQSKARSLAKVVTWDAKFGLVKVAPLLRWTRRDVWAFLLEHDVPYNPLLDQGYTSIGCWPCTRAVRAGEDERAGRWDGWAKTECGLHSLDSSQL